MAIAGQRRVAVPRRSFLHETAAHRVNKLAAKVNAI
jgi:hypothetical protein